ncbi:phosphate/phosphite/phosphonate ABC transporter substrate-binding protein [Geobacter hydrogenophilus]|uniref:Phosphonate ABC transporter substrate-binding protein n=1 Tax=Geobacter hydrogenophilus TaxID=40983 RepID=A0A9W6G1C4_9BACT|nr:phosphate/phosphite/phosphonate ABC transporter substrate-binding protein [Geobacter hydrogenophilus]MBT0892844.1 phosphate/phosphite/phosphonate ABC transporter substrate-binding protein [Geobacter hydrogenophilus]GLI38681.1 phosphonate ABC transporter substrate-binding protein [Geobacter hydrogenophilus]
MNSLVLQRVFAGLAIVGQIIVSLRRSLLLLPLVLLLAACNNDRPRVDMAKVTPDAAGTQVKDTRPPLHIAVAAMISPETTRQYYEELLRLVADRMGRRAVFSQRRTYAEVNTMVMNKEVDAAFVCAGPYVQGHEQFGMEILAVPVVHGVKVYHSYIIANRNSSYTSLNDLRGKKFAFTDPDSNTGSMVPTYMLAKRGETPDSFFGDHFFSNSHDNSIKAVANGQADGAAVDSLIWEFMNTIDPNVTSRTRIIEKSSPYGIPPIVVHPAMDPATKKKLKQVLLTLHEHKESAELLAKLQIDRFAEGDDKAYDTVREMSRWLEKEKGR